MVSVAIPASCIDNSTCSNLEQATYTLYEISRACVMFNINEIVVYDPVFESPLPPQEPGPKKIKLDLDQPETEETKPAATKDISENLKFTADLLQYLVTPKHLRTRFFKSREANNQFKYAKRLPPIPYLVSDTNIIQGIAVPKQKPKKQAGQKRLTKKARRDATLTPYINLGFERLFELEKPVQVNSQVSVDIKTGEVVADKLGGYTVRAVSNFSHVFTECPIGDGYSQTLYVPSQQFQSNENKLPLIQNVELREKMDNTLLVFGKWSEVESSVKNDNEIELEDASGIFDGMVVLKPRARMEDSVMIALSKV